MSETEQDLIEQSRRGDRDAFAKLVRSSAKLVFAKLYIDAHGDAALAEDLTQETFLLAWRSIGKIKDASAFRPWLMTIAKSVATDSARHDSRKKRDRSREEIRDVDATTSSSNDPLASAETNEQRERLLKALAELPETYRLPLTLRYLDDADYETISKQLALSNGSLRGLLQRGMAMLREKMNRGSHESH